MHEYENYQKRTTPGFKNANRVFSKSLEILVIIVMVPKSNNIYIIIKARVTADALACNVATYFYQKTKDA